MTATAGEVRQTLDRLARRERGRLVADLVYRLGASRLDMAEDVTHEAVLSALSTWPYKGLPDNPGAWLRRVARNKAIDRLRREGREVAWSEEDDRRESEPHTGGAAVHGGGISDPELRMIFLVCRDGIGEKDRVTLMLNIVSGFTAREIAGLFLEAETATAQRLARAKRKLRRTGPETFLEDDGAASNIFRMRRNTGTILKGLYLMFVLGYAPRAGASSLRRDVAMEALRLVRELAGTRAVAGGETEALAALMCFHAARFDTRETEGGDVVLLRDQDRGGWDRALIAEGQHRLTAAQTIQATRAAQAIQAAQTVSRYHLEAGIAAAHALAPDWASTHWEGIVALYTMLRSVTRSPVVGINRAVALSMAGKTEEALRQLEALKDEPAVERYGPYHLARGDILEKLGRRPEARAAFATARTCPAPDPVKRLLDMRFAALV